MLKITKESLDHPAMAKDFIQSFNYDASVNSLQPVQDIEQLKQRLKTDSVYIVLKQHKYIGFFINPYAAEKKEISLRIFRNPKACPFSARSLMKAAFIRALGIYLFKLKDVESVSFESWHPSLVSVVQAIVPFFTLHHLTTTNYLCYYQFEQNRLDRFNLVFEKYTGGTDFNSEDYEVIL